MDFQVCVDHVLLQKLLCEEVDAARCLGTGDVLTSELLLDVSFQNISQFSPVFLMLYFNAMDIFQVFSGMAVYLENSATLFAAGGNFWVPLESLVDRSNVTGQVVVG